MVQARHETVQRVARARMLRDYAAGDSIPVIARRYGQTAHKVGRCVKKALEFGPRVALNDLRRAGRRPRITPEARAWIIRLACQKPKDVGWAPACWSEALLARYVREHAVALGHPSAARVQQGTLSKILAAHDWHPHRFPYYLQRRDPDLDRKMVPVLPG